MSDTKINRPSRPPAAPTSTKAGTPPAETRKETAPTAAATKKPESNRVSDGFESTARVSTRGTDGFESTRGPAALSRVIDDDRYTELVR